MCLVARRMARRVAAELADQAHSGSVERVEATRLAVRRLDTGPAEVAVHRRLRAELALRGL